MEQRTHESDDEQQDAGGAERGASTMSPDGGSQPEHQQRLGFDSQYDTYGGAADPAPTGTNALARPAGNGVV